LARKEVEMSNRSNCHGLLIAGTLAALVGLSAVTVSAQATSKATVDAREEVYVVRARPTGPEAPVTSFCADANLPASHPVQRERPYEYLSISTDATNGKLIDDAVRPLGNFRGCYSARIDGRTFSYGKGTLAGIPFTIRGSCTFTPERDPAPGVTSYACNYVLSGLSPEYVGGQSLWNGVATDQEGYLTTTIATLRLWRAPSRRQ
jgi:hypothetical protein